MGTMSSKAPRWIPIFSTHPHANVRAYMSTYHDRESRLLHIDRTLIRHVLGHHSNTSLLCELSTLTTYCLKLTGKETVYQPLSASLTMNALHKIFAAEFEKRGTGMETVAIVHTIHSVDSCIAINLE
jgi:hypothetical protein